MNFKIVKGKSGQMGDILDFIHLCFALNYDHGFEKFLPKLYGHPTEELHYLAMDGDKIVGVVCVMPFTLRNGNRILKCNSVGSVSAHPRYRGKGIMSALMSRAVEEMDDHVSFLGGNRNRYANFGYEKLGYFYNYTLIGDSFNKKFPLFDVKFSEDISLKTYELFRARNLIEVKDMENFKEICGTWSNRLYSIYSGGEEIGYIIYKDSKILELEVIDEKYFFSALKKHKEAFESNSIAVAPTNIGRISFLNSFCEDTDIMQNNNINILNVEAALEFYLNIRYEYKKFEKDFVLQVKDEKYKISVNSEVSVSKTDEDATFSATVEEIFGLEGFMSGKTDLPLPLYIPPIYSI